jgi:hypothetical protein
MLALRQRRVEETTPVCGGSAKGKGENHTNTMM